MVEIKVCDIKMKNGNVKGLTVIWNNGQYVAITGNKGFLGCGAFDLNVMEEFNFAVAIAKGTPEHPFKTPEDLLNANVASVTKKAIELGIFIGMKGKDALEKLV